MAKKPTPIPPALVKTKTEGLRLVTPLESEVQALTIEDKDDYDRADVLLSDITRAIKTWESKMEPILAPLRQAKTAADRLNREVAQPLSQLYDAVRAKMREWKLEDDRRVEAERRANEAKQAKLTAQLEETAAREAAARTSQMRQRLEDRRKALEDQVTEAVLEAPVEAKAEHSTARKVRAWRCVDSAQAIQAQIEGLIPEVFELNSLRVNSYAKQVGIEEIASWPGFEVYDDIIIARK